MQCSVVGGLYQHSMDANPFSIESILKKNSPLPSVTDNTEETQPSRSTEALSLAVKLAGKHAIYDKQ